MATDRQIEANRKNAEKSCGPRTSEGKAKVAMNALKHGLLAKQVVLPNEDEEEFRTFSLGLEQQLLPVGEFERMLVESIAAYAWRLRRLVRVEKGILIRYTSLQEVKEAKAEAAEHAEGLDWITDRMTKVWAENARAVGPQTDEATAAVLIEIASLERRLREEETRAKEAEDAYEKADGALGLAFMSDAEEADAFAKLSRYEAHIQRSMFKALNELERLQAARRTREATHDAAPPPPPPLELEEVNGNRHG